MASINIRSGRLQLDFYLHGRRCREATGLPDTPANRRRLRGLLRQIEAEIVLGNFDYGKYFPNSKRAGPMQALSARSACAAAAPTFAQFATVWFAEKKAEWRESTQIGVQGALDKYLLAFFGAKPVSGIGRNDIMQFRAELAGRRINGRQISASRVNHILSALKMILEEAAERYGFASPWRNIRRLRGSARPVKPFSLPEVMTLIATVRPDFRNYLTVRFFTGMRSGEIDGLQWPDVDFGRREINVHRCWVLDKFVPTKTAESRRSIRMARPVFDALQEQKKAGGRQGSFVFLSPEGTPIRHSNFRNRVWNPLLRHLGYEIRTPYHTRHTAASLWLAAGESPEWIARQLGHSNTEMLFRVYSRYAPNLTRDDGSAFERLLAKEC